MEVRMWDKIRGAVKKFPEFYDIDGLVHHEFVPPGQSVTGHFCLQVSQRKRRDKWQAGRDSDFCITMPHRAIHYLLCSNSCHHLATVFSGSCSQWLLALTYSENRPQGDTIRNHEGHQIECDAELRKVPKEAFRRCFQQWQDRWSKCACARVRA
jgi:hypothetical protein